MNTRVAVRTHLHIVQSELPSDGASGCHRPVAPQLLPDFVMALSPPVAGLPPRDLKLPQTDVNFQRTFS